ncbi:hypothetical protein BJX63DRAFT_437382 [Aspergillus granulosus]|uniref:Uncharacterized protein n=1 Tax=Aspergillus granulosus TaxID=176169 RepID=A0ABR4GV63_9EURO
MTNEEIMAPRPSSTTEYIARFDDASRRYLQQILRNTMATNKSLERELRDEKDRHNQAIIMLNHTRTMYEKAAISANQYYTELLQTRAGLADTQYQLGLAQEVRDSLFKDLGDTRRKLYLVDEMLDIRQMKEEGRTSLDDRGMQITDVILALEQKMEARYREELQQKDNMISRLTQASGSNQAEQGFESEELYEEEVADDESDKYAV